MSLFFLLGTLHHCLFHDGLDALLFARSSHVTLGTVVLEPKLVALVLLKKFGNSSRPNYDLMILIMEIWLYKSLEKYRL